MRHRPRRIAAVLAVSGAVLAGAAVPAQAVPSPGFTVVARNLDNPRKISFGPDGSLYVAEAGHGSGGSGPWVVDPLTGQRAYYGFTGAVTRVRHGVQVRVATRLGSWAVKSGAGASGPAAAAIVGGTLRLLLQDAGINATGANRFGPAGRHLGQLVRRDRLGRLTAIADFARFEAAHNPDKGAGARPGLAIDSDPYGMVAYRGGWAVVDAAANDLLWVSSAGQISVLAVFPIQMVHVPAGVAGPTATTLPVQSVPTCVTVGRDGALYVGELTGFPFAKGLARVWRVLPGQKATVFARGFTNIAGVAFDRRSRLTVLEMNVNGLSSRGSPGAVIQIGPGARRTVLASAGLVMPTALVLGPDGRFYVSNFGVMPAAGPGPHGEVVRL